MARISTYNLDTSIDGSERLISSNPAGTTTENVTVDAIASWLNSHGVIGIAGQSNFRLQTIEGDGRENGTVSLPSFGGNNTAFSSLTTLRFSALNAANNDVSPYLLSLVTEVVILFQLDNISNFGIYSLSALEQVNDTLFYDATLTLERSNGNLVEDKVYGFAIYPSTAIQPTLTLDNVTDEGAVTDNSIEVGGLTVGSLTYPSTDGTTGQFVQTDGSGNLSFETVSIPTLDSVTTEGSVTTNTIEVGGVTSNGLVKAVADTLPTLEFYAESQTNPTANEDMGSVTFSRLFDNPDLQTLATALYNPFVTRVEADGGTVEGTAVDLRNDLDTLLAGKVATDTARMRVEYTDTAGNMSSDFVFYTTTAGLITEKFRVTKDGNIEVKEALGGVVIRSKNDTPYRILVDNDGRLEATALDAAAPVISGVPTITGLAAITETITAVKASVTSSPALTTTYQWQVSDTGTGGWSNISGATSSSYLIPLEYANKFLRVQQIETNIIGQTTAFSAATSAVIPSLLVSAMIQRLDNFENENYVYDSIVEFDAIEI